MNFEQIEAYILKDDPPAAISEPQSPNPTEKPSRVFANEEGIKMMTAHIALSQGTSHIWRLVKDLFNMVHTYKLINSSYYFDITQLPNPAQTRWNELERPAVLAAYLERVYTGQPHDSPELIHALSGVTVDDAYLVCRLIEYANSYLFNQAFTTLILKAVRALFTVHFPAKYPRLTIRMPRQILTSMSYMIWRNLQNGAPNLDMYTMTYIGGFVIWLTENRRVQIQ